MKMPDDQLEVIKPGELSDDELFLAEAETHIRGYGKMMIASIDKIGCKLVEIKERFAGRDGRYTAFVTERLGWSMMSAQRFVQVHRMLLTQQIVASDLTIGASALYKIAAPSTPAKIREQVLSKAASPDGVSRSEVDKLFAQGENDPHPLGQAEIIADIEGAFGISVHPVNAGFPMMTGIELASLAASIKTLGLFYPIALDHTGKVLIDGKCRLAACKLAGVTPKFERLDADTDPEAYNVSMNLRRASYTEDQRAMAAALAAAREPDRRRDILLFGVSEASVAMAEAVLQYSPKLAEAVRDGSPLGSVFDDVVVARAAAADLQQRDYRLTQAAPDLASRMSAGELTLREAEAVLAERQREHARMMEQQHTTAALDLLTASEAPSSPSDQ